MPVVSGSLKQSAKRKGGKADVEKLLEHTDIHPEGRIQIDPATGKIRNPKNNVLFKKKVQVKLDGMTVAEKEIEVMGGHVKAENSVWRIALKGPSRYHWKVIQDDERFRFRGIASKSAPVLENEELKEYQYFRVFLAETGMIVEEQKWDETDKQFYAWLKKQDLSKIKIIPLSAPFAVTPVAMVK